MNTSSYAGSLAQSGGLDNGGWNNLLFGARTVSSTLDYLDATIQRYVTLGKVSPGESYDIMTGKTNDYLNPPSPAARSSARDESLNLSQNVLSALTTGRGALTSTLV